MTQSIVLLLLDESCHVISAISVEGTIKEVEDLAQRLHQEHDTWGYELWADGKRVGASYECSNPPARMATAIHPV